MYSCALILVAVNFKVALSCTFLVFPEVELEEDPIHCCPSILYGGERYNFFEKSDKAIYFDCNTVCVYTKGNDKNSRYCFKEGGFEHPECTHPVTMTIEWPTKMDPFFKCVAPGTNVTFEQPGNSPSNIAITDRENYLKCDLDKQSAEPKIQTFNEARERFYYFISDEKAECESGRKGVIVVDKDCECKAALHATEFDFKLENYINKSLLTDSEKDKYKNLTVLETWIQFFNVSMMLVSRSEATAMGDSSPCSPIRHDCDLCFGSIVETALGCTVDASEENCPEAQRKFTTSICNDCMCNIVKKTCDPNRNCKNDVPLPVEIEESCDRPCTDQPRKCVFNLKLESHSNDSSVDGNSRKVLKYNDTIPGPPIVICEGDVLEVNLDNGLSEETTLHFHGIREINRPWNDGVPYVTQCPIPPGGKFTYNVNAINLGITSPGAFTEAGAYWYHSHVGAQRTDGAYGALIIRKKDTNNEVTELVDKSENTLLLQEWYDTSNQTTQVVKSLIINGKGRASPSSQTEYPVFNIDEPGKKYLFRVIGAISQNFPLRLSIDDHKFTAVAADSQNIEPVEDLTDLWVAGGERFDIVVQTTKQKIANSPYKIRVFGHDENNKPFCTIAWLVYKDTNLSDVEKSYFEICDAIVPTPPKKILNPVPNNFEEWNTTENIFIKDLRAAKIKPSLVFFPDNKIDSTTLKTHYIELKKNSFNMKKMILPNVPFLLQDPPINTFRCGTSCTIKVHRSLTAEGADKNKYLKSECSKISDKCTASEELCSCEHVIEQPHASGYWSELVLINGEIDAVAHPIHQHGGWFWVLGMGKYDKSITKDEIIKKDDQNCEGGRCLSRNYDHPVAKDTIQVPPGGYVILATPTDNKGTWFFHCHINRHVLDGMAMVLQVGGFDEKKYLGQDWCTGPLEKNVDCSVHNSIFAGIQWKLPMQPVHLCVRPGSDVTFVVHSGHNVNRITKLEYDACNVNNESSKPETYDHVWSAPQTDGIFYFACGIGDGYHCNEGMNASISVSRLC